MTSVVVPLCLLSAALMLRGDGEQLLISSGGGLHSEYRVIDEASFNIDRLRRIAREFLVLQSDKRFAQLHIVTARAHVESVLGTMVSDTTYDWIVEKRRRYPVFPVARVTARGANAVMQVRDARGKQSVEVLAGRNPLKFIRSGKEYEIVWTILSREGADLPSGSSRRMSVGVYVVTSVVPGRAQAEWVWEHLVHTFQSRNLSVWIRPGAFFVSSSFPLEYPFITVPVPDSEAAYLQEPSIYCFPNRDHVRCVVSGR
jgi:hypothetical protein